MKHVKAFFILIISLSFSLSTFGQADSLGFTNKAEAKNVIKQSVEPHLKDTDTISGNFVLFLIPDSIRFAYYAQMEPSIYETDGDFAVAIVATLDSISKCRQYKGIKSDVSTKRYIVIKGCKNCPRVIDRDTVDYGLILVSSKMSDDTINRYVHSGDYLSDVDAYFNLNNK